MICKDVAKKLLYKYYFSSRSQAIIFMLHRVCDFEKGKLFPNENMKVSPSFLENFILKMKSKGYEFISLDQLYDILVRGEKTNRKILLTLDDGYKDNYLRAYPIFKKHKVPFCIYVTTSFPEGTAILWWYILEDIILKNDYIFLSIGKKFLCETEKEKISTFLQIRKIIMELPQEFLLENIQKLFSIYDIDWYCKTKELALSWEEIQTMAKDDLCTIGCHTTNHYVLSTLSYDNLRKEIIESRLLLESKIGKKIEHFCYPFGGRREATKREYQMVKKLGFKTATTTLVGTITQKYLHKLYSLPRIMLTEGFNTEFIS